jgi:phosphatidylserine/phosphatidylglycerophosphate/cardiolipin synthase-like enzyme
MAELGMSAIAMAWTLDLLASTLASRPALEDIVDLVTTAPAASRVANRDTAVVVSELFRNACTSVVIAGYAVHQGQRVFHALAERMKQCPDLKVRMFLDIQRGNGDTSAPEELVRRFLYRFRTSQWPAGAPIPQIFYDPRAVSLDRNGRAALHAKCVVVDETDLFVSSANFTEAAQERNIEVGLLLRSPWVAARLSGFFDALVASQHFRSCGVQKNNAPM